MSRLRLVAFIILLISYKLPVSAQESGCVVIHSDPRIDLLLRKKSGGAKPVPNKEQAYTGVDHVNPLHSPVKQSTSYEHTVVIASKRNGSIDGDAPPGPSRHESAATEKRSDTERETVVKHATNPPLTSAKKGGNEPATITKAGKNEAVHSSKTDEKVPTASANIRPVTRNIHRDGKVIYSGSGFRVQIYYGTDRAMAMKIQNEFTRKFPGVSTYLTYISPTFRVKVGDYRNRAEAQAMLKEANKINRPSMIVPDAVAVQAY